MNKIKEADVLAEDNSKMYVPTEEERQERELFRKEKNEWYTFPLTFWEIVEKLNWKDKCTTKNSCKELAQQFRTLCGNNTYVMEYFDKFRRALRTSLQETLREYQVKTYGSRSSCEFFRGGDDSYDDFANHIIGLGKEVYFSVLTNPENAKQYMDEYVESFAYCFHF